jgi:hypothetical protein
MRSSIAGERHTVKPRCTRARRKLPATVVSAGPQYQELTKYNTTGLISPRQITAKLVRNIKPSKRCVANNMSIRVMVIILLIRLRTGKHLSRR